MGIVKVESPKKFVKNFSEIPVGSTFVPYGEPERLYLKVDTNKCYNFASRTIVDACPYNALLECESTLKWNIV